MSTSESKENENKTEKSDSPVKPKRTRIRKTVEPIDENKKSSVKQETLFEKEEPKKIIEEKVAEKLTDQKEQTNKKLSLEDSTKENKSDLKDEKSSKKPVSEVDSKVILNIIIAKTIMILDQKFIVLQEKKMALI